MLNCHTCLRTVRLIDVFALGPFMIWFGLTASAPPWAKLVMIGSGIATIVFNAVRLNVRDVQ